MRNTDFTKFRVALPDMDLDHIDVAKILAIDMHDLETTMRDQPTLQATFSLLAREAERQLAQLKFEQENLEYQIQKQCREECEAAGERFVKTSMPEEYHQSEAWVKFEKKIDETEHVCNALTSLESSLQQRYGMVQQIAKRRSNELANLH